MSRAVTEVLVSIGHSVGSVDIGLQDTQGQSDTKEKLAKHTKPSP